MIAPHVINSVAMSDMRTSAETSHAVNSIATRLPNRMADLLIVSSSILTGARQCL